MCGIITYLQASTNTQLTLRFWRVLALMAYRVPTMEAKIIRVYYGGAGRGSIIMGRSVHIERDLFTVCVSYFYYLDVLLCTFGIDYEGLHTRFSSMTSHLYCDRDQLSQISSDMVLESPEQEDSGSVSMLSHVLLFCSNFDHDMRNIRSAQLTKTVPMGSWDPQVKFTC